MVFENKHVEAINLISAFLAHQQIESLTECAPVDVIVLCPSSVLPVSEYVFAALENRPDLTKYLVISGGIGHSTKYLHQSIANHPRYRSIFNTITSIPEARILEMVLQQHYASSSMTCNGLKILIEDKSTNCGANAFETRNVLQAAGLTTPQSMFIVQDPTMSLRTLASFEKVYENQVVEFKTCPTFIPRMALDGDGCLIWDVPGMKPDELWETSRFLELLMGEVPRLRDDENGYGPRGKRFISHVEIPEGVTEAYVVLQDVLRDTR